MKKEIVILVAGIGLLFFATGWLWNVVLRAFVN
jgi:hypothetical protein